MNNYSQDYGNYFEEEQQNFLLGDGYYHEEQRGVPGSSGMNNAHEDYDMYDDVDELLNDIGRYMRSKMCICTHNIFTARSSPSPPDRSHRDGSRSQVLMSPQYRQTAQHHEYRHPSPHAQYEEAHESYEDEPFEEQYEPPPSYQHNPPPPDFQFTARSAESRTCEMPFYIGNKDTS